MASCVPFPVADDLPIRRDGDQGSDTVSHCVKRGNVNRCVKGMVGWKGGSPKGPNTVRVVLSVRVGVSWTEKWKERGKKKKRKGGKCQLDGKKKKKKKKKRNPRKNQSRYRKL